MLITLHRIVEYTRADNSTRNKCFGGSKVYSVRERARFSDSLLTRDEVEKKLWKTTSLRPYLPSLTCHLGFRYSSKCLSRTRLPFSRHHILYTLHCETGSLNTVIICIKKKKNCWKVAVPHRLPLTPQGNNSLRPPQADSPISLSKSYETKCFVTVKCPNHQTTLTFCHLNSIISFQICFRTRVQEWKKNKVSYGKVKDLPLTKYTNNLTQCCTKKNKK